MLAPWRRRGEGAAHRPLQDDCNNKGSIHCCEEKEQASGSFELHHGCLLHMTPFPRFPQREPVVQHNRHALTPERRRHPPVPQNCDTHASSRKPHFFVTRLLPPVLFRRRQRTHKQGSDLLQQQQHSSSSGGLCPQPHSVPAYYYRLPPSSNKSAAQQLTTSISASSSCSTRTSHPSGQLHGGSVCGGTHATLEESQCSKDDERVPAASTVPVVGQPPTAKQQGSMLEVFRIVTAATRRRDTLECSDSRPAEDVQETEVAALAGIRRGDVRGHDCPLGSTQWHHPLEVARRHLSAEGRSNREEVVSVAGRGSRDANSLEVACGKPESGGLLSASSSSGEEKNSSIIPLSQPLRGEYHNPHSSTVLPTLKHPPHGHHHDRPSSTVLPTAKHPPVSAFSGGFPASCGRQIGPQKDPGPVRAISSTVVQHARTKVLLSSSAALAKPPLVEKKRSALLGTKGVFSGGAAEEEATTQQERSKEDATPSCLSTEDHLAPIRVEQNVFSQIITPSDESPQPVAELQQPSQVVTATCDESPQPVAGLQQPAQVVTATCDESPQPVAGLQQPAQVVTATSDESPQPLAGLQQQQQRRNNSSKNVPNYCSNEAGTHGKVKAEALQARKNALHKESDAMTTVWRPLRCASSLGAGGGGRGRLSTIWSVESLSDALVVRRGLAAVLLIDGVGSATLLRRALSKPGEWKQQLLLQNNTLTSSIDDDEDDIKVLNEMPAKVRSKGVILKILQGSVSLQQMLPVDVTQVQADLRLLSLQQLVVLRLKNVHNFESSSQYHSCHASFLHTLDFQIAELLGAFLVNEAFFNLFVPLVEQETRQQTLASKTASSDVVLCGPAAGEQQNIITHEDVQSSTSPVVSQSSFSRASTRCSSPQMTRSSLIGWRQQAGTHPLLTTEETTAAKATEPKQSASNNTKSEHLSCSSNVNIAPAAAPAAAADENDHDENNAGKAVEEGRRKLRWGRVACVVADLQRTRNSSSRGTRRNSSSSSSSSSSSTAAVAAAETSAAAVVSLVEGGDKAEDVARSHWPKPVWTTFSKEEERTAGSLHMCAPRSTEEPDSQVPVCDSQKPLLLLQRDTSAVATAAAAPRFGWRSDENLIKTTTGRQAYKEKDVDSPAKAEEKPRAAFVEAQARFLVKRAAAEGLLSTYSPSSFDIPTGEAAATRAQLRALGAGFVRQLGVLISAAGKDEVSSSSRTNGNSKSSSSISAADMGVLHCVQKYVLPDKNGQQQQEEVMIEQQTTDERTISQDKSPRFTRQNQMQHIAAGTLIKTKISGALAASSAASAGNITRPAGVWVRLLVPWKPCTAKTACRSIKGSSVGCSPVVTSLSTAATAAAVAALHCSPAGVGAKSSREEECATEEERGSKVAGAARGIANAGGRSGPNPHSAMTATSSPRHNLAAAIAAARSRRAAAVVARTAEVETHSSEEKLQNEYMEAFLWLRLPTARDRVMGNTAEAAAAATAAGDRRNGQEKMATLQQQQQQGDSCQERVAATTGIGGRTKAFGRGVFELVVSNDRPVGEALLWGLPPQKNHLLCKDAGPGNSTAVVPSGKLAKWTVALLPQAAVLQQHLGRDAQAGDVVSELKELLSRRCGAMKPPVVYQGGDGNTTTDAAMSATRVTKTR